MDCKPDMLISGGYAMKFGPKSKMTLVAPSLVELYLSDSSIVFPKTSLHVKEVGAVEFSSWDEEVLFVLSHELAHIDQAWESESFRTEHAAEVDAEKRALFVLKSYRTQTHKR